MVVHKKDLVEATPAATQTSSGLAKKKREKVLDDEGFEMIK